MKILLAHNRYAQRGGEDTVFDQERRLLVDRGHEVTDYLRENRHIDASNRASLGLRTIWADDAYREVKALIERTRPDVMHVHNTLPLLSPSIYYAAAACRVPVVQTLHNYRLLCANGMLIRNAGVCEDCVGRTVAWPAVVHKCYRGDRNASFAVVGAITVHRAVGTWRRKVARYVALCGFSRDKLLEAGLPPERVVVKPNFARDEYAGRALHEQPRKGALFLGRLSPEKGVKVMIDAWQGLRDVPLTVIGTGDMAGEVRAGLDGTAARLLGYVSDETRSEELANASFVVMPSLVYEGFPMVLAETYSAGTPVIASRLGALAELVEDGVTGLHFNPSDPIDLAAKVRWAHDHPAEMARMGQNARRTFEQSYTAEASHTRIMEIYREAIAVGAQAA